MKKKKKLIIISIILILAVIIGICLVNRNKDDEYIVGVGYLPQKDAITLDCGELSYFVNELVYPSMIDITKDGYTNVLAKNISIDEASNTIDVTLSGNYADYIIDSYLELNSLDVVYENDWKYLNIVGCEDYQTGLSDTISGITKTSDNKISFQVEDVNDLEFLTIPTIKGDLGTYTISEYNAYDSIVLTSKGNPTIIIKQTTVDDNDIDMFITGLDMEDEDVVDFNTKEIYPYYDYLILVNYNEDQVSMMQDLLDGKKVEDNAGIGAVNYWYDSTSTGYNVTQDLTSLLDERSIELRVDYIESYVLLNKLKDTTDTFMAYYMDDYYDYDELNLDNVDLLKIGTKHINFYYKPSIEKFLNKYF